MIEHAKIARYLGNVGAIPLQWERDRRYRGDGMTLKRPALVRWRWLQAGRSYVIDVSPRSNGKTGRRLHLCW